MRGKFLIFWAYISHSYKRTLKLFQFVHAFLHFSAVLQFLMGFLVCFVESAYWRMIYFGILLKKWKSNFRNFNGKVLILYYTSTTSKNVYIFLEFCRCLPRTFAKNSIKIYSYDFLGKYNDSPVSYKGMGIFLVNWRNNVKRKLQWQTC